MKLSLLFMLAVGNVAVAKSPNVLIVIADDMGWGDLGAHGNPVVRTPNLDKFAKDSVWLKHFYVSPVCSPTRSSLLTGLYNYRTGVVDTFRGRSMMRPDVVTLPQTLEKKGYRTGLFGKWHLGDNYPLRPEDRGFGTTLWHRGGGLSQPADPPGTDAAKAYFDPVLVKNGKETPTKGYCTDIFTDAAIEFIKAGGDKPFFTYVAYNAPHSPFQVPDDAAAHYRKLDLTAAGFPKIGQPWATPKMDVKDIANAYGMIENIDTNFSRLMKTLDDMKLAENTIVIFLTDNGPGGTRFNSGLRSRKGTVYDGGLRVPCYIRASGVPAKAIEFPTQHIDITPTILNLAEIRDRPDLDGIGLDIYFREFERPPDRTLYAQWHRGEVPEKGRAFMARHGDYKLVQSNGVPENANWTPKLELFDLSKDEFEQHDLAVAMPEKVKELNAKYEQWFDNVTRKGFKQPRIVVGNAKENPLRLSRQEWIGEWTPNAIGTWNVEIETAGRYQFTFQSRQEFDKVTVDIAGEKMDWLKAIYSKQTIISHKLKKGALSLKPILSAKGKEFGPDHLTLELKK